MFYETKDTRVLLFQEENRTIKSDIRRSVFFFFLLNSIPVKFSKQTNNK